MITCKECNQKEIGVNWIDTCAKCVFKNSALLSPYREYFRRRKDEISQEISLIKEALHG